MRLSEGMLNLIISRNLFADVVSIKNGKNRMSLWNTDIIDNCAPCEDEAKNTANVIDKIGRNYIYTSRKPEIQ